MDKSATALQQNNNVQTQQAHSLGPSPPINRGQPQKAHPKHKPEQAKVDTPKNMQKYLVHFFLEGKKILL